MTRATLLFHLANLDEAARRKGWSARGEIGEPATEAEIERCEATLDIDMPDSYRRALREWNGCMVEFREEPQAGVDLGCVRLQWYISDIRTIIAATEVLREQMSDAMARSAVATQVGEMTSRVVVIVYWENSCVFLPCDAGADPEVCAFDLEYALGERPPIPKVIAQSADDYLAKSFGHLATTLETEIYWC